MFFDVIKSIYRKDKIDVNMDDMPIVSLCKWLSFDKDNLQVLRRLLPYIFWIEPTHFYYLLFFNIPQKSRVPFLKKIEKEETTKDKLLEKIKYILGWSSKELSYNKAELERLLVNRKHWEKELGV